MNEETMKRLANKIVLASGADADAVEESVKVAPEAAFEAFQEYRRTLNGAKLAEKFASVEQEVESDEEY